MSQIEQDPAPRCGGRSPLILYYHMVSDERLPHISNLYPYKGLECFRKDIEFLCRKYRPMSLEDVLEQVRSGRAPRGKRGFLLTFDDGYREMSSVVAPILSAMGVPAVFFLCSDFIDNLAMSHRNKASLIIEAVTGDDSLWRPLRERFPDLAGDGPRDVPRLVKAVRYGDRALLDRAAETLGIDLQGYLRTKKPYLESGDIREMIGRGFSFGGHSRDHPLYAELTLEEQLGQTIDSITLVKEKFGLSYSVFAFPHNDHLVGAGFFKAVASYADLTFGTAAEKKESSGRHLQRLSLERTGRGAGAVLRRYSLEKNARRILNAMGLKKDTK